jgi:hypothetical protein
MGLLHDSDEYGIVRWPLAEIAQGIGCPIKLLQELVEKSVLKGADIGQRCLAFIYQGFHARKLLAPVVLIEEQTGPLWYSSRMVKDEYLRHKRGNHELYKSSPNYSPGKSPEYSPNHSPKYLMGELSGDLPSSSSSLKPTYLRKEKALDTPKPNGAGAPRDDPKKEIFDQGVAILTAYGDSEQSARRFLGKQIKGNEAKLKEVLGYLTDHPKADPKSYILGAMRSKASFETNMEFLRSKEVRDETDSD